VVDIKGTKVGLLHGHQIIPWGDEECLYNKARELDVDILITGHTHEVKFSQLHKIYLANPGSLTGAFSSLRTDDPPSFLILEFKSKSTVIYSYSLVDNDIKAGDFIINKE
jgi:vacuolar protein sorting-associated protein 29